MPTCKICLLCNVSASICEHLSLMQKLHRNTITWIAFDSYKIAKPSKTFILVCSFSRFNV